MDTLEYWTEQLNIFETTLEESKLDGTLADDFIKYLHDSIIYCRNKIEEFYE